MGDSAFRLIQAMNSRYNLDISALEELVNKRSNDLAHIKYDQIISLLEAVKVVEVKIKKELSKYMSILAKDQLFDIVTPAIAFIWVYILSIITFPHYESSRYPRTKEKTTLLNTSDYSLELGIVKAIPKIIPLIEKSIQGLYQFHEMVLKIRAHVNKGSLDV